MPSPADPQDQSEDLPDPLLEAGMSAAFAAEQPEPAEPDARSTTQLFEQLSRNGQNSQVLLRGETDASDPLIRPLGQESDPLLDPSRYQVRGEIARGGVGVVMHGHDRDLGRDVALKFLRQEHQDNPVVMQRFVEEAQIGGQLQHPGIVPVYELGVERGRPFFTMKLIRGRTLAALLEDRGTPQQERRRMLDVFEAVCQAIAYTHARGVIHRDLKPANVMVGAFGEVQVVDWGLAKVLRQGGTTDEKRRIRRDQGDSVATVRSQGGYLSSDSVSGSVMGTPSYMPPEQARGEVEQLDERSDVFSLGAILCEILSGKPPFPGNEKVALDMARAADLRGAEERLAACGSDEELIRICLDCLRTDPKQRPRSAQILAERVASYLHSVEDRAEKARIDAAAQRVQAAADRRARRLTLGLAMVVLVSILAAAGGYILVESDRRQRITLAEGKLRSALEEGAVRFAERDWTAALTAVQRAAGMLTADIGTELRSRVAQQLEEYRLAADAAAADEVLREDNERLLDRLMGIRFPEGSEMYPTDWRLVTKRYAQVFRQHGLDLSEASPETGARLAARGIPIPLAAQIDAHAQAAFMAKDEDAARHLTGIADRLDPDPTRSQLRAAFLTSDGQALRDLGTRADFDTWSPTTLHLLGGTLLRQGSRHLAVTIYRRAQERHPADFVLNLGMARALKAQRPPRNREALQFYRAALALDPKHTEVHHELGVTLSDLGEHLRALAIFEAATRALPGDGHLWSHLGTTRYMVQDTRGSVAAFERALKLRQMRPPSYRNFADALAELGQKERAIKYAAMARTLAPNQAANQLAWASTMIAAGKTGAVVRHFKDAVARQPEVAALHCALGTGLTAAGRLTDAVASFRRALDLEPSSAATLGLAGALRRLGKKSQSRQILLRLQADNPSNPVTLFNISSELAQAGHLEDAATALHACLKHSPDRERAYRNLALLYIQLGLYERAERTCRRALSRRVSSAQIHYRHGTSLVMLGRFEDADRAFAVALAKRKNDPSLYRAIGTLFARQLRFPQAFRYLREGLEIAPDDPQLLCNLGTALRQNGQPSAAIPYLRRGHALGSRTKNWRYPSARWIRDAERAAAVHPRLMQVVRGDREASNLKEASAAARLALNRLEGEKALSLYERVAETAPHQFEDPKYGLRYDAACAALLVWERHLKQADSKDQERQTSTLRRALTWLREDLEALALLPTQDWVRLRIKHFQVDPSLLLCRQASLVDRHAADTQKTWRALWKRVAALIKEQT